MTLVDLRCLPSFPFFFLLFFFWGDGKSYVGYLTVAFLIFGLVNLALSGLASLWDFLWHLSIFSNSNLVSPPTPPPTPSYLFWGLPKEVLHICLQTCLSDSYHMVSTMSFCWLPFVLPTPASLHCLREGCQCSRQRCHIPGCECGVGFSAEEGRKALSLIACYTDLCGSSSRSDYIQVPLYSSSFCPLPSLRILPVLSWK